MQVVVGLCVIDSTHAASDNVSNLDVWKDWPPCVWPGGLTRASLWFLAVQLSSPGPVAPDPMDVAYRQVLESAVRLVIATVTCHGDPHMHDEQGTVRPIPVCSVGVEAPAAVLLLIQTTVDPSEETDAQVAAKSEQEV